jgi:hypothetical protein
LEIFLPRMWLYGGKGFSGSWASGRRTTFNPIWLVYHQNNTTKRTHASHPKLHKKTARMQNSTGWRDEGVDTYLNKQEDLVYSTKIYWSGETMQT